MIQEPSKVVFETFNPTKDGDLPEYADKQVLKVCQGCQLEISPSRPLSSWLRLPDSFGTQLRLPLDLAVESNMITTFLISGYSYLMLVNWISGWNLKSLIHSLVKISSANS